MEREVKRKTKNGFSGTVVLVAVLVVFMLSFKLYNDVQLADLTNKTSQLKKTMDELNAEQTRLNVLLEKRTDLRLIEKRATEELGLKKIEKYQIEYVALPTKDKAFTTIKNNDDNVISAVTRGFSVLLEFLS
jgi:regulator of replication initiation timing